MGLMKQGQGAAKAASELMRTPERQALADAIAAREHVAALVEERRAVVREIQGKSSPLYRELDRLEEALKVAPATERGRLEALLNRREPEPGIDRDAITQKIASVRAEMDARRSEEQRAEADVRLLEEDLGWRQGTVRDCITDVVIADPAVAAVAEELKALLKRRALLGRAIGGALSERRIGQPPPRHERLATLIVPPEGNCPWAEAKKRLVNDPDAVLPMPADV